jgi:hypothetical protein
MANDIERLDWLEKHAVSFDWWLNKAKTASTGWSSYHGFCQADANPYIKEKLRNVIDRAMNAENEIQ